MSDRKQLSQTFLAKQGWGDADRSFLAGDASDRRYDRLTRAGETCVLMDAPPGKGDDPASFIAIATHLSRIGLSPPAILAQDLSTGFLLIEDLGDRLFARILAQDPGQERALYRAATDVLIHLQAHDAPTGLPNNSALDWATAAAFALDWYAYAATGTAPESTVFVDTLAECLHQHADRQRVLILRDYHAENLLQLLDRTGVASVGLLDFQLAQMGQPGYDLISLVQDARRDVSPAIAAEMIAYFAAQTGRDLVQFEAECAVLGAQRTLRILGIFARLCVVGGKPTYLRLVPRVWQHLQSNLSHPALADLRRLCDALLPEPTETVLKIIGEKCATLSP